MIVVFDSNIWLSELGLRSNASAAVRFYLKHSGARVALPEVVRLEVEENLSDRLLKHINNIRSDFRQLLTAFGNLSEVVLPGQEEVHRRIQELFASLQVPTIDVPFTLDSARNSFLKTIRKIPPTHPGQQFKDGVLWADCLSLLENDDVVLVTSDKAFYQGQRYSNGIAKELEDEASARGHGICILPKIADLLESLQTPVTLDPDALQSAFVEAHEDSINGTLERNGFSVASRTAASFKLFATDDPSVLFIDFTLTLGCVDARGEGRTNIEIYLKGDGNYLPHVKSFQNLRNFGERLQYRMPDGRLEEKQNHVLFADGLVLGHKQVSHVTRYQLPQNEP